MDWIIEDWTGKHLFPDQSFQSFQDGWNFLNQKFENEEDGWQDEYFVVKKDEE